MSKDTIYRQDAIDAMSELLKRVFPEHRQIAEKCLNALPSAQPDRKTGHWIHHEGIDDRYEDITCSICHKSFTVDAKRTMDIGFIADDFEFCPHCGAQMKGEEDG